MKKKVQTSRMYLAGLVLLVSSTFAWAMPSQWLTNAEEMAADYVEEIVYGDVVGGEDGGPDGNVSLSDVTTIIDFYIEKLTPTDRQLKAVDFDANGSVNLSEVTRVIDLYIEKLTQQDIKDYIDSLK